MCAVLMLVNKEPQQKLRVIYCTSIFFVLPSGSVYLHCTSQRIPRYRLLLETILQHTAIESSMHSKVEESLTTMGGIASKIDADLSLQEKKDKVLYQ